MFNHVSVPGVTFGVWLSEKPSHLIQKVCLNISKTICWWVSSKQKHQPFPLKEAFRGLCELQPAVRIHERSVTGAWQPDCSVRMWDSQKTKKHLKPFLLLFPVFSWRASLLYMIFWLLPAGKAAQRAAGRFIFFQLKMLHQILSTSNFLFSSKPQWLNQGKPKV